VPAGQDRGPGRRRGTGRRAVPASVLVLTGIVSVQVGAGLAGRMFGVVAPAAITGLRLWWAAAVLLAIGGRAAVAAVRGLVADRAWRDGAVVLAFGVTLGIMNYSIYQSFARIPLGIAVTIEFLGPLAVAVASSRRLLDGLWVLLAGAGVALLSQGGFAGGRHAALGVAFALAAAASWAGYILLSRATGRRFGGSAGLSIAMVIAAVVVTPPAIATAGRSIVRPDVLLTGLAVGLLSSVIPYRLELEALRRVPARVFGIWMSLEPAVAALAGLALLGQSLGAVQWLAIACVMAASAGSARAEPGGPEADPAEAEAAGAEAEAPRAESTGAESTGAEAQAPGAEAAGAGADAIGAESAGAGAEPPGTGAEPAGAGPAGAGAETHWVRTASRQAGMPPPPAG
jgi:inner membrane transporter RhtA